MDHGIEEEFAGAASVGGFLQWRRKHALPAGSLCRNCNTTLQGPWCHACGQAGHDFHRSIWHLSIELIENLFHADGRLFHTVPRLIFRPAQLTRDFLAGKRAAQIPPLRLLLVVLLLVFVSGSLAGRGSTDEILHMAEKKPADVTGLDKVNVQLGTQYDAEITAWMRDHLGRAATHPAEFIAGMKEWSHDVAFLMLPISALILSLMFAFRRGFVVFDHIIFSLHSLSFQGLLFVAILGLQAVEGGQAWWLILASPVHLFAHMRGVYNTSWYGTLLRMFVLFNVTTVAFTFLLLMLMVLGLSELRG